MALPLSGKGYADPPPPPAIAPHKIEPDELVVRALDPEHEVIEEMARAVVVALVVVELPWMLILFGKVMFPFALIVRAGVVEVAKVEGDEVAR